MRFAACDSSLANIYKMGAKRKAEHLDEFGPEDAKSQSPSKELPVTNSKTEESLKSKVDEIHKETYKKREEAYALLYRKDIEDMSSALNEKKIEYQEWARYQQVKDRNQDWQTGIKSCKPESRLANC